MAKTTAQQWMDKWGRRLNSAGPDIKAGIDRVKTAPGVAAAAAQDRMLAGVTEAVNNGSWAKAVSDVSLNEWKELMVKKAIPRMAQGVTAAQQNKMASIQALLSDVDEAAAASNALPKGGLAESMARANTFMTEMSRLSKARKT